MICPKCEAEFVDGITICSDCEVELIQKDNFELNLINYDDWSVAFSTDAMYEAEMIKANLEGADIEAIILSQADKNFPSYGDLSIVKLLVKNEDIQDAKNIINDINK